MILSTTRRTMLATVAVATLAMPRIARSQAAEKLSVRVDFSPWGMHAALHLASVNGWFRDAMLAVDVQDGRGSANTLQLVNAGQVDVGQIQVGLLGQARAAGAVVRSFAGWCRRTDLAAIIDQDAPYRTVADLRGKNILVFAASPWSPFIDAWLRSGGLDRNTVNLMLVDPAALWGTYAARRADVLLSTPASALPVVDKGRPSRAMLAEQAGIAYPSYGLIATEATLRTRGDALKRLAGVQQRAWDHIRGGGIEDGVAAMLAQRPDAKLDPATVREQIRLSLDFFDTPATAGKPLGWQAAQDWQAALQAMQDAGLVKPGWAVADYYTNDLIA